jgi:hypothetical protein
MKIFLLTITLTCLSLGVFAQKKEKNKASLRHVVLFSFKSTSSADDIKSVEAAFYGLYGKVPQIKDFEWGKNMSPEQLNQGFTHCFFITYHSLKDLNDYQEHPAHREFQKVLGPHMDKVLVIDYWVESTPKKK